MFHRTGWGKVVAGTLLSVAVCIAIALFVDSFNFASLSEAARMRSIATDIGLPIVLGGPISFFLLLKLRDLAIANGHLEATLGAMGQGLSRFDARLRLMVWNDRYAELFGMAVSDLRRGMAFRDILAVQLRDGNFEGDPDLLGPQILATTGKGQPLIAETRMRTGRLIRSVHMPAPAGGWIATHEDITALDRQRTSLAVQNERFGAVLSNMQQGVCMFDAAGNLVTCNDAFVALYGLPPHLTGSGIAVEALEAHLVGRDLVDADRAVGLLRLANDPGERLFALNDERSVRVVHSPTPEGGWVATHEDVTARRKVEAQIEHDAFHDALTGLPNRRYLERELKAREQESRQAGRGLALLHLDLDWFKRINDTLGHGAGDAMLVHAAEILRQSVRPDDFVARVGGDEFIILTRGRDTTLQLRRLSQRLIRQMSRPVNYEGHECRFGASIGMARQDVSGLDVSRLLVSADIALYRAKTSGRGRLEVFTTSMQAQTVATKRLADQLMRAIEQDQFVVHYQPKMDAKSRTLVGIEALVRWQHPTRGLLSPGDFLPIAEELGAVATIDEVVLTRVLDDRLGWLATGLAVPPISVNVSSRRLRDPGLPRKLAQLNIPPGSIAFELLESIYLDEADEIVSWNLDQIREMGIDIDIDDFGTGHTSVLSLLRIRPVRLKIDRRLVSTVVESGDRQSLVRSIVEIGHSLGSRVVAEGVETHEQADILAALGCDEFQGYAFSRPVAAADIVSLLSKRQDRRSAA